MPSKARISAYERNAYLRLEVDRDKVAAAPRIAPLLRKLGGVEKIWEYLEISDNFDARKIIATRDRLSGGELKAVPFEAVVMAAGMTTRHAFGVISEAIFQQSQELSAVLVRQAMPDVIEQTIERAKSKDGTADTKLLMQHTRFIPMNKNLTTVHQTNIAGDVVNQKSQVTQLPAHEDRTRRLNDRFNRELTIPEAPAPIDIEYSEDEDGED